MGLFRRKSSTSVTYVPLARPKMHESRLLDAGWFTTAGRKESQEMSGLAARAHYALDHGMMEIAGDDVLPCVELLHSMLKTAPDPVGIAAGKNLAYEACVGWSIAQIERQRKDYREGYTHPTIHNGLVVYYACGERTEFKDSLTLAVEVGYYAARAHVNRPGGELPGQILSELYGPTLREPS